MCVSCYVGYNCGHEAALSPTLNVCERRQANQHCETSNTSRIILINCLVCDEAKWRHTSTLFQLVMQRRRHELVKRDTYTLPGENGLLDAAYANTKSKTKAEAEAKAKAKALAYALNEGEDDDGRIYGVHSDFIGDASALSYALSESEDEDGRIHGVPSKLILDLEREMNDEILDEITKMEISQSKSQSGGGQSSDVHRSNGRR